MSTTTGPTALRRLAVDRLRVMASVGILEHELAAKQALVVSVAVEQHGAPMIPAVDDVHHVLDYRHLRDAVLDEARSGHVNMLETLAGRIAQRLLARRSVRRVQVRITKPNIFPDCDGASVDIDVHARDPD